VNTEWRKNVDNKTRCAVLTQNPSVTDGRTDRIISCSTQLGPRTRDRKTNDNDVKRRK